LLGGREYEDRDANPLALRRGALPKDVTREPPRDHQALLGHQAGEKMVCLLGPVAGAWAVRDGGRSGDHCQERCQELARDCHLWA
jgi:hypothetical protein